MRMLDVDLHYHMCTSAQVSERVTRKLVTFANLTPSIPGSKAGTIVHRRATFFWTEFTVCGA